MNERNKQTAIRFIEAMSNGDAATADACLAPGAIAVTKGFNKFSGVTDRNAVVGLIGSMRTLLPTGLGAMISKAICEGDSVAIEFDGDAVTNDGTPYHNQYCMVFTFDDGLIVRTHEYFCTRHAEEALWPVIVKAGLLPEEGRP